MADKSDDDSDQWSVESDYAPPEEGSDGPPETWDGNTRPSWFNPQTLMWWWYERPATTGPKTGRGGWRPDPCPVTPLGNKEGQYIIVTAAGEMRRFTAGQLHGRGGPADLFGGELWWPLRHFRKWDAEKGQHSGGLQSGRCMAAIIRACRIKGYFDESVPHRSVGTWRGPDGAPVVHAGDRIFVVEDGVPEIRGPGVLIGEARYVIGAARQAPTYINLERGGFEWQPGKLELGHQVAGHLDEWHWQDGEARDLFLGGLACDMLGDALLWKPHRFVRAAPGSGKSLLLKYARALLGGAAHPIQKTYSKAYLEDHFGRSCCAFLLDETESDTEAARVVKIMELIRLLSDDGSVGGRFQRAIDLHGSVTMVATVTEAWTPQDRSRIAYMELRSLRDRPDHPPMPLEALSAMIEKAAEMSAGLRARIIVNWPLFCKNLKLARAKILAMGGTPRDADQLGHLIAGWATMTSDRVMTEDEVKALQRFEPYILSLSDQADGADAPNEMLNVLFGLPAQNWRVGDQLTIGMLVYRAREDDGAAYRDALRPYGMQLVRLPGESWAQAWLAIANKHPGLDRLMADYPQYRGPKRAQILSGLRKVEDGQVYEPKPSERPLRFAGSQARALLLPPIFLPSRREENEHAPEPPIEEGPA